MSRNIHWDKKIIYTQNVYLSLCKDFIWKEKIVDKTDIWSLHTLYNIYLLLHIFILQYIFKICLPHFSVSLPLAHFENKAKKFNFPLHTTNIHLLFLFSFLLSNNDQNHKQRLITIWGTWWRESISSMPRQRKMVKFRKHVLQRKSFSHKEWVKESIISHPGAQTSSTDFFPPVMITLVKFLKWNFVINTVEWLFRKCLPQPFYLFFHTSVLILFYSLWYCGINQK